MSMMDAEARKFALPRTSAGLRDLDSGRLVLLLLACGTIMRLLLASLAGLGIDESYMVGVSRQFSWSYFDHPPIHVWLVGLWAKLFGEGPLTVRMPFILLFAGSTWLMYRLTARAYGERAGLWAAVAFNLSPVFTLSTASWVLPDGPMVFFLLLSATCVARALLDDNAPGASWLLWLAAGVAGGLALLSKYLAIFLFLGVGLFLLTAPRQRHWLARPQAWLGLLVAAFLFTPVLIWNVEHDFASFAFQGHRGIPTTFKVKWFLQDAGGQFFYLLPTIAAPLAYVLFRGARSRVEADWFFFCLAAPAIIVFLGLGFVTRILPHWPMAGWLFAFPLLGDAFARWEQHRAGLLRVLAKVTVVVVVGFFAVAASQASYGWIGRLVPMPKDPTLDLFDWRALNAELAARALVPADGFVATGHWIEAGKINYALGGGVPVLCLCDDARHFRFLHDEKDYWGADAVLLARDPRDLAKMEMRFESAEELPDLVLRRAGRPAVTLKAARATRLKPAP